MTEPTGSLRAQVAAKFMRHDGLCALIGSYGYCSCGMEAAQEALLAAQPAPPTEATEARAVSIHEVVEGPRDCMWRSGHDGTGPDPSRFFCDVVGPPPSCHVYRAVADTEVEARALAFRKAEPVGSAPTEATPPHDGLRERARRIVEEGGPHEWGYRDPVDGTFIVDNFPFEVAAILAAGEAEFKVTTAHLNPAPPMTPEEAREVGRIEGLEEAAKYVEGHGGVIPGATVFAAVVSGNNMPTMSGDDRDRLHSPQRKSFDRATASLATAIRTLANGEPA